jgi:hypothetical protein
MRTISFRLPSPEYIKKYGGSTALIKTTSEMIILMSARNSKNYSVLLHGKLDLESNNILDLCEVNINPYNQLDAHRGFSYPCIISSKISNEWRILLTEWYSSGSVIRNRLCVATLQRERSLLSIIDLEYLPFPYDNAGAARLAQQRNGAHILYIPFFDCNGYNMYRSKEFDLDIAAFYDMSYSDFERIDLGFKRVTCFSQFVYSDNDFAVCAVRNDDEYCIHTYGAINQLKPELLSVHTYPGGMTYPTLIPDSIFPKMIVSLGRYGASGLATLPIL